MDENKPRIALIFTDFLLTIWVLTLFEGCGFAWRHTPQLASLGVGLRTLSVFDTTRLTFATCCAKYTICVFDTAGLIPKIFSAICVIGGFFLEWCRGGGILENLSNAVVGFNGY